MIAFLDSDDMWKEDKLQKQVAYLAAHPYCRIVYTAVHNFTDISESEMNERQKELLNSEMDRCLPSALIDVRLFHEIGMFDEDMPYGEDTDWNLRLRFFKVDIVHCLEEALYLRRIHGSNISNTTKKVSNMEFWKMVLDSYRKTKRPGKELTK
jgi:GT2 family glycosyltransferase